MKRSELNQLIKENRKIKVPVEMIMETELLAVRYERDKIYVK